MDALGRVIDALNQAPPTSLNEGDNAPENSHSHLDLIDQALLHIDSSPIQSSPRLDSASPSSSYKETETPASLSDSDDEGSPSSQDSESVYTQRSSSPDSQTSSEESSLDSGSEEDDTPGSLSPVAASAGVQHGEGRGDFQQDDSSYSSSSQAAENPSISICRERFNNREIRRTLNIPQRHTPDLAQFYTDVRHILSDLAVQVSAQVRRSDLVQLEVRSENNHNHLSLVIDDRNINEIADAFDELLDRMVQSNESIASDSRLEFIAQIVVNPSGGVKRKLQKTLDCEIISKKKTPPVRRGK